MPLSQMDGEAWIPTLTNRDSNLPDLLWVNTTSDSGMKLGRIRKHFKLSPTCKSLLCDAYIHFSLVTFSQINTKVYSSVLLLQAKFLLLFLPSPLTCSILAFSHPAQQGKQLAAVTYTQTQCVVPLPEAIKFFLCLRVIGNSRSPTFNERIMLLHNTNLYPPVVWFVCLFTCLCKFLSLLFHCLVL